MEKQKNNLHNQFEYYEDNDAELDNYNQEYEEEFFDESEFETLQELRKLKTKVTASSETYDYEEEELPEPLPKKKNVKAKSSKRKITGKKMAATKMLPMETKVQIVQAYNNSGMSASVFGPLVGVSEGTLNRWKKLFNEFGPEGLERKKDGQQPGKCRLPEVTQQAILMIKEEHEEWGCLRIHDMLLRSKAFSASPGAIKRLLLSSGYEIVEEGRTRHPDKPRRFERARPQQMYQTDIFTFILKRQNVRIYMIAYMDDCSRYIVSFGLTVKATSVWAQEVLGEAITFYGPPEEVLTDQGPQYHSWRGTSAYNKFVTKCGIKQIVARAHHPQTLGKVERFWQTLWNECIERAIFKDLTDARERIAQFVGWYNFRRTHQGINGMLPADRFFGAETAVRGNIEARVASNALEIARHGSPRKPFYLTGRVGDQSISLHAEGDKVVLTTDSGLREEVDLSATGRTQFNLPPKVEDSPQQQAPPQSVVSAPIVPVITCEAKPPLPAKPANHERLQLEAALQSLAEAAAVPAVADEINFTLPVEEPEVVGTVITPEKGDSNGNSQEEKEEENSPKADDYI